MDNQLVSIIIPAYNASTFIGATIRSILHQTYSNIELILVNDGSTDNTEQIIYSFQDSRIRYLKQKNTGTCSASNFGLLHAKGDFIKFFDADDLMNPQHIAEQLYRLDNCVNSIASCAWGRFYEVNPESAVFNKEDVWKDMFPLDWLKTSLKQRTDMMPAWLWLIPKQILIKSGGLNENLTLNNDFEFSVRLLLHAEKVFFAAGAKVYYRSGNRESLSINLSEQAFLKAYEANYLGCSYLLRVDSSDEMKIICANRYQEWIFRIYPKYPNIVALFQKQIDLLGGSSIKIEGGFLTKMLNFLIGWRLVKKIKFSLSK